MQAFLAFRGVHHAHAAGLIFFLTAPPGASSSCPLKIETLTLRVLRFCTQTTSSLKETVETCTDSLLNTCLIYDKVRGNYKKVFEIAGHVVPRESEVGNPRFSLPIVRSALVNNSSELVECLPNPATCVLPSRT